MNESSRYLAAALKEDWALFVSIADEFEQRGGDSPAPTVAVAFCLAAKRHFGGAVSRSDVIKSVADVRVALDRDDDLDPRLAEELICAALGLGDADVGELIRSVDHRRAANTEGQLLLWMIQQSRMSTEEIDAFVDEVEHRVIQLQGVAEY